MVTTDWRRFHEHKDNGLVSDVFASEARMAKLPGDSWPKYIDKVQRDEASSRKQGCSFEVKV